MDSTGFQHLQPGDERAYEAMAQVAREAMAQFLSAFEVSTAISAEQLVQRLLLDTERALDTCCRKTAKLVRQCATTTDVRGIPTVSLAGEIRNEVFKELDAYIQPLSALRPDLRVLAATLKSDKGSARLHARLVLEQAKGKIIEARRGYLEIVEKVPEALLDYARARCFGSQISFERQSRVVETIRAWWEHELKCEATPGSNPNEAIKRPLALVEGDGWKCEACGMVGDSDSLEECADCGKLLCSGCINRGCCGHIPARISVEENQDDGAADPAKSPPSGPMVRPRFLFWLVLSLVALFAVFGLLLVMADRPTSPLQQAEPERSAVSSTNPAGQLLSSP